MRYYDLIFDLLRLLFNGPDHMRIISADNWRIVSDVVVRQGVSALVHDSVQVLSVFSPDSISFLEKDRSIKYDLFGHCLQIEKDYDKQWRFAKKFAVGLADYGIRVFVLKGFAISELYPIPEHRPCSDLDCFLIKDKSPAFDDGNLVAAYLGYGVKANYYKHSKIKVGSLIVENHQYCLPIKGDPRSKKLNRFLLSIIDDGELRYIGDSNLLSPSPMFNAIYILAHAREHFFNEGILLRHICDWACLMRSLSGEGEVFWDEWKKHCTSFGLMAFGYSLSRLATRVCGVEVPFECPADNGVDDKVLEDVFRARGEKKRGMMRRVQLVRNLLSSRWKFREFSDRSALGFTIRRVWGYLMENDTE